MAEADNQYGRGQDSHPSRFHLGPPLYVVDSTIRFVSRAFKQESARAMLANRTTSSVLRLLRSEWEGHQRMPW